MVHIIFDFLTFAFKNSSQFLKRNQTATLLLRTKKVVDFLEHPHWPYAEHVQGLQSTAHIFLERGWMGFPVQIFFGTSKLDFRITNLMIMLPVLRKLRSSINFHFTRLGFFFWLDDKRVQLLQDGWLCGWVGV